MGYGFLNIASLVLGLVAWVLPITALILNRKLQQKNVFGFTIISASFCALAIYFQTVYSAYLVKINDIAALLDTAEAVSLVSGILLAVAFVLNAASLAAFSINNKPMDENS